jgi:hypothetical protein
LADLSNNDVFSEIDSSNTSNTSPGFPIGMSPSGVAPNAQALQGATKRWFDKANPTQISTGSPNTQALTYPIPPDGYTLGDMYYFIVGNGLTNTGATTLNVNSLGEVNILIAGGALIGGELVENCISVVALDSTNNFQLLNSYGVVHGNLTVTGNANLDGNLGVTGNMDVTGGTILNELVATAETTTTLQVLGTCDLQGPVNITGDMITFGGGPISFLPSSTTFYVSPTGSDSTGTGSISEPYATAQKVYSVVTSGNTIFGTASVTIIHLPGTYNSTIPWFNPTFGNWVLESSTGIPADIVISCSGANIDGIHPSLGPCNVLVQNMTVSASGGYALSSNGQASLVLNQVNVGTSVSHINAYDSGYIEVIGNYSIIGGAQTHVQADHGTVILSQAANPVTVTSVGSIAISLYFANIFSTGYLRCVSGTFSGVTMTAGSQYSIVGCGVIESGGESNLTFLPPFNSSGSSATGGQWL